MVAVIWVVGAAGITVPRRSYTITLTKPASMLRFYVLTVPTESKV